MIRRITARFRPWAAGVTMLLLLLFPATAVWASAPSGPPPLSATAAILVNGRTGQILYARNIHQELYPASITKIMTAYLAVRYGWNKTVHVSVQAQNQQGSSAYLRAGENLPMPRVATAMMLVSGNDAAWAIAQTVSGSVPRFVQLMNATAAKWKAPGIHFANPSGLPNPKHVVTALGMAVIAEHAMQNPTFRQIVQTKSSSLPPDPNPRQYYNQNRLLYTYSGAVGVKLGYTIEADETVVAAAQRNGTLLIAVLLHDTPAGLWPDAANLLSYGFQQFTPDVVLSPTSRIAPLPIDQRNIPVAPSNSVVYMRRQTESVAPTFEIVPNETLGNQPIWAGENVGQITVRVQGKPLATVALRAQTIVAPKSPPVHWQWFHLWTMLAVAMGVLGCFLLPVRRIRRSYR